MGGGGDDGVRTPEDLCIALEGGNDEELEAVEAALSVVATPAVPASEPEVPEEQVLPEPIRPKPPEGNEILRGRLIPRGFTWTWRVDNRDLGTRFEPDEQQFYVLCLCDKCIVLEEVTESEFARRSGELCRAMIESALNDLFLVEDKKRKAGEPAPRAVDPNLLERLRGLQGKRRVEALTSMRSAFTWIFTDDRAVFRHVIDTDGQHQVEVCIPFLVACETVGVLAEVVRAKVRADMETCKLTPRMIKSGQFPRPQGEAAVGVAKAEARVDRLFRLFGKK